MASVEARTIPDKVTRVHIKISFRMPAQGVLFASAETEVAIEPAAKTARAKKTHSQENME